MKLGTLIYIVKNNKTLMLHRIKKNNDCHEGLWVAPGGKVELNETPEKCAIRETFEETGLIVKSLKLKGILTFPDLGDSPFGDVWYCWVYITDNFEGNLIESPEGKLEWIDNDKMLDLPMWEGDKIFTPLIYQEKIFSGEFTYTKNKFLDYNIEFI